MLNLKNRFIVAAMMGAASMVPFHAASAETTPEDYYKKMDWPERGSVAAAGVDLAWNKAKQNGDQLLQSCLSYTYPLDNPKKHDAAVDDIAAKVQGLIEGALEKGYTFNQLNHKSAEFFAQKKVEKHCKTAANLALN